MADFNMFELVGKRLRVKGKDGRNFGLGTYLWEDEILLDSGKKVLGKLCVCEFVPDSKVPPFTITLRGDTRVFQGDGFLRKTGYWLPKDERVEIIEVTTVGWNHGEYVAGKFFYSGEPYWFIMSEVELPMETPHLQLVS